MLSTLAELVLPAAGTGAPRKRRFRTFAGRRSAPRIGLASRGRLAEEMTADIGMFDLALIRDNDDWASPHQYAEGFSYVIVGETLVIDNGERTDALPGRVLRKTGQD